MSHIDFTLGLYLCSIPDHFGYIFVMHNTRELLNAMKLINVLIKKTTILKQQYI